MFVLRRTALPVESRGVSSFLGLDQYPLVMLRLARLGR